MSFQAQIDEFIRKTRSRMTATFRIAAEKVIEDAQTPVAKGGRMRVDTSFLRNSAAASLTGMPSGPVRLAEGMGNGDLVALTIAGAEIGDTIYFGWTADYARYREYQDGFLRLAAENWQRYVDEAAREVKASIR